METDEDKKKSGNSNDQNQAWWQPAVAMFVRLSAWVAGPVVVATVIGNWLDEKYDSAPWGLISIVGMAFVISMIGLVVEATKEYRKINTEDKKLNNKTQKVTNNQEVKTQK